MIYATILFINILGFVQNGFILLYQYILNNLYHDPTNDITRNIRKLSIEFNLYLDYLCSPFFLR